MYHPELLSVVDQNANYGWNKGVGVSSIGHYQVEILPSERIPNVEAYSELAYWRHADELVVQWGCYLVQW